MLSLNGATAVNRFASRFSAVGQMTIVQFRLRQGYQAYGLKPLTPDSFLKKKNFHRKKNGILASEFVVSFNFTHAFLGTKSYLEII
jgi:hypothetical protein